MKIIKYEEIKTPKTIEEFRTNLKKYFVCIGENREILFVKGRNDKNIRVDTLTSFNNLYNFDVTHITPTIVFDISKISDEEIYQNINSRDFSSVLSDEKRFPIYEMNNADDVQSFIHNKNPQWIKMDNQILRCFFIKTLGDFSGYVSIDEELMSEDEIVNEYTDFVSNTLVKEPLIEQTIKKSKNELNK
jgi:hypothetical protein